MPRRRGCPPSPAGASCRRPPELTITDTAPLDELAAQSLRRGNTLRLRARGGSMQPFLLDGDMLVVRPAAAAEIRIGDVICYEPHPGGLCLHRVIARRGRGFVTRGDALTYVDTVAAGAVLGLVVARGRRGRWVALDSPHRRRCARLVVTLAPVLARLLPLARWVCRAGRRG